jgi:shikimate kinase
MSPDDSRASGLVLVGYRGTGKSTVGRLLAGRLGLPFVDADAALEARLGRSISEVFARDGEAAFRDAEAEVLAGLDAGGGLVLATGGGAVLREANRRAIRRLGRVAWLTAGPATIAGRLAADPAGRPALTPLGLIDEVAAVLEARRPLYREVADLEVGTDGLGPAEVAELVLAGLDSGRGAPR